MALTYIIDSFPYNKNVGGICALHYLGDRLTHFGASNVYLMTDVLNPRWKSKPINLDHPHFLGNTIFEHFYKTLGVIKRYVIFNTFKRKLARLQKRLLPNVMWMHFDKNRTVVIYPEVTIGNPLQAKHVVRWIMNTPGVCGGDGIFDPNDHIFLYHPWYLVDKKYKVQGLLTAIDLEYQLKIYQNHNYNQRNGGAYLIRKGRSKKHELHPPDFIYADAILEKITDEEAAKFFNRIQTLISYDEMTWTSVQAALCGCTSIIIAGDGDRSIENLKKVNRIYGVAYGFDDQDWVIKTRHQLRPHFEQLNVEYQATIRDFYIYCEREIGMA